VFISFIYMCASMAGASRALRSGRSANGVPSAVMAATHPSLRSRSVYTCQKKRIRVGDWW